MQNSLTSHDFHFINIAKIIKKINIFKIIFFEKNKYILIIVIYYIIYTLYFKIYSLIYH